MKVNHILRVFPSKTKATPLDARAYHGLPDLLVNRNEIAEIHVSVTFTWHLEKANRLRDAWEKIAPVKIGGPAFNQPGGEFEPGMYLRCGYVITSRGCPRKCWFCRVPKVEGPVRELPIRDGWNIQDDNILATSRQHFEAVCVMLAKQKQRAHFTGGLEALLLQDWHVHELAKLRPRPAVFFAYDPGDEYETLAIAARKMLDAGWTRESHRLRCYVLIGYPRDTFGAAEKRLTDMLALGFTPCAMLWRNPNTGLANQQWQHFQRVWTRPAIIHGRTQ